MAQPTTGERKIRVLIAKPGLDGHDRGAKVVARALRDAGMEVIYTGLRQSPEQIVEAAIQEDVDVVGLSVLSGAHMTLFPRIVELLRKEGAQDIVILGGGIIPDDDMKELRRKGLYDVFGPGTNTDQIIEIVKRAVTERRSRREKGRRSNHGARAKARGSRSATAKRSGTSTKRRRGARS